MYRIIIADDERVVLNGIKNTINWERLGIEVAATAENGQEFYEKAIETQPDIALVDIRMPQLDGLTAIERLKPLIPDCQFIIFTAYEDFHYAKKALELGVMGYITKPVLKNEVIEKVELAKTRIEQSRAEMSQWEQGQPGRGQGERGQANRGQAEREQRERDQLSAIERIKKYMQSHVDSDYTLMDVAEYMQMNPTYLSRYFKEKTHETFMEYDKRPKMERAEDLLTATSMKTYEIAEKLGYKSVQHFSRIFKESTGMTPIEYRQKSGEKAE